MCRKEIVIRRYREKDENALFSLIEGGGEEWKGMDRELFPQAV